MAPYCAVILGLNVMLLDFDEQANLSLRYVAMRKSETGEWIPEDHPEAEEIFREDPEFPGYSTSTDIINCGIVYPYPTNHPRIKILPPHGGHVKEIASKATNEEIQASLYNFFNLPEVIDMNWDIVIIDTPPSLGALTLAAIRAATHVLIPAILETKCMEGLTGILTKVNMENRKKPKSEKTVISGILPTQYQKQQPLHNYYYDFLKNHPTFGPMVLHEPMYARSDIKTMDEKIKNGSEINAITPFDKSAFKAKNRRECEDWCKAVFSRIYGAEEVEKMIRNQAGDVKSVA
jgi:chromosome partitioning protein